MTTGNTPMDKWETIPWKQIERNVFKLQKRIYQASKQNDRKKDPLGFYKWFQDSKNKEFLSVLATALILALDARSSAESAPAVPFKLSMIPILLTPAKPQKSAMAEFAATLRREQSQVPKPSQEQPQMPRTKRIDPLASLMKDKVQLLHMLAEYQEERDEEVTGQLLEPFNEATIAAAARRAAREARREYYFRPHGLSLAAIELSWVIENELLDPRSESVLVDEVLDQIERLKEAVEKMKPKRKPW